MVYAYNGILLSHHSNEVLIYVTACVNFKNLILNRRIQPQNIICYIIAFIWNIKIGKSIERESRVVVSNGWEKWLFNEYEVSFWDNDKVLEQDSGEGCLILCMYLMPLNCTLYEIKIINFMMYILSQ